MPQSLHPALSRCNGYSEHEDFYHFCVIYGWHYLIQEAKWVDITNRCNVINTHTLVLSRVLKLHLRALDIT